MLESVQSESTISAAQLLAALKDTVRLSDWEARNAILTEFYNRYSENLATTWLRRTHNPELTEEILQETFTRATARLHAMPDGHSVLIWLRTTARNFYVDRMRKSCREQQYPDAAGPDSLPRIRRRSFDDALVAKADQEKSKTIFERYIRGLDPQDRRVMILRFHGLQMSQIGPQLGISERECRRSYARVRFLLQKMRLRGFSLAVSDLLVVVESKGEENG